jgi:threonine/homoserine/homoserine lactone efflux protein
MANGAKAGLIIILGLCTGLLVHTTLVAVGLGQLIKASPSAMIVIGLVGAFYLLYLAWGAWNAGAAAVGSGSGSSLSNRPKTLAQYYRRGVVMNVTNPKVLLFFLAFLPQFLQPTGSATAQILILGGVFALAAFMVFTAIALAAAWFAKTIFASAQAQARLNKFSALVLVLLAGRLLFAVVVPQ